MSNKEKESGRTKGELTRDIQLGLRELTSRVHRINDLVGSQVELQAGDLEVLDLIARHGPLSPREITAASHIHPATMTGMLDRLESGGWVKRTPDPSDRRKLRIEALYDRGGDLLRLYGPMNRSLAKICSSYTIEELETIVDFVRRAADAGVAAAETLRH